MNSKYVSFMAMLILSALFISCLSEGDDPNKDLNNELKVIDAFLEADPTVSSDNILYDNNSRIRFVFLSYGQGLVARDNQIVEYTVTGSVLTSDGLSSPFINTSDADELEDIVPEGLQFALRNMLGGSAARVYVPSRYAYGAKGDATLKVPANAIIEYRVVSDKVKRTSAQQTQFELDTAAIRKFVDDDVPTAAIEHPSGIWYSADIEGAGTLPTPYSSVTFDYELRLLATPDKVVEANTLSNQLIFMKLIDGFSIALQLMKPGATYTFYMPSGLAYGPNAQSGIPANANLIFKIKLTSVND